MSPVTIGHHIPSGMFFLVEIYTPKIHSNKCVELIISTGELVMWVSSKSTRLFNLLEKVHGNILVFHKVLEMFLECGYAITSCGSKFNYIIDII